MMERLDAIAVLQGMHKKEFSLQTFAESNGNYTAEWYHSERAEALQVAISILEMLNQNKCKAEDAVKALQICFGLAQDIERLLTLAYLQGGGDDEQS